MAGVVLADTNITVDNLSVGSLFRDAFRNIAHNFPTCSKRLSVDKPWINLVLSGGLVK